MINSIGYRIYLGLLATLVGGAPAMAQTADAYPNRSITMVVAFPAAGTTDILARLIGQKLTEKFKQTVVVENRAGAGGNIACETIAKAAPDGYTIGLANVGSMAVHPHMPAATSARPTSRKRCLTAIRS